MHLAKLFTTMSNALKDISNALETIYDSYQHIFSTKYHKHAIRCGKEFANNSWKDIIMSKMIVQTHGIQPWMTPIGTG